jgi:type IV secretory pathway VirB4 component
MLRLDRVIKPWREAAALNDHVNLYGFWNETAFLTKSGDIGMVLRVSGVDYESLDHAEQEYAVKRLESAFKSFGSGFHVYQYLFKQNRPEIPFAHYDDPIVETATDQRRRFFDAKRDRLYQVEIFYCVVLEGARSKTGIGKRGLHANSSRSTRRGRLPISSAVSRAHFSNMMRRLSTISQPKETRRSWRLM